MAKLTPLVLGVLRHLNNDLGHCLYPPLGEMGQEACWNWALTGFSHNAVWPTYMFDIILTGNHPQNVLSHHGRGWFADANNRAALQAIRQTYTDTVVDGEIDTARTQAVAAVTRLAMRANGLIESAANGTTGTPYRLFVEYKTTADNGILPVDPSFHHVWLDVLGRAIEIFPGRLDIQIYQGSQHIGAYFQTWSIYLAGLHQLHVDRIVRALADTRANWGGVPAVPANRQNWIQDDARSHCAWCGRIFAFYRRRHHCRRCGEIFCDSCSDYHRDVNRPATRPGDAATAVTRGARVCVRCS